MKKTLVLGASPQPERYSYLAVKKLIQYNHPVCAVGNRAGNIDDVKIYNDKPIIQDIDTITLYIGRQNQPGFYEYIFKLNLKRLIFNPGTENPELQQLAEAKGIETLEACTLTLLATGQF